MHNDNINNDNNDDNNNNNNNNSNDDNNNKSNNVNCLMLYVKEETAPPCTLEHSFTHTK